MRCTCTRVFSAYRLAVCIFGTSDNEKGLVARVLGAELQAPVFGERVCVHVSPGPPESHLPHPAFPLCFLLSKQPVVLNCHQGSQNCIFTLDGGGGEQMTPSVSFWDGADLEPRAKAREASCHPRPGKEPPLRPLLPLAELMARRGKVSNLEARRTLI